MSHLLDPEVIKDASANNSAYVIDKTNSVQLLSEGKATTIHKYEEVSNDLLVINAEIATLSGNKPSQVADSSEVNDTHQVEPPPLPPPRGGKEVDG